MTRAPFLFGVYDLTPLSGSIKKGNRKSEILLRDVEVPTLPSLYRLSVVMLVLTWHGLKILATLASLFKSSESDYVYPQSRINDSWERVLLNQCTSDDMISLTQC